MSVTGPGYPTQSNACGPRDCGHFGCYDSKGPPIQICSGCREDPTMVERAKCANLVLSKTFPGFISENMAAFLAEQIMSTGPRLVTPSLVIGYKKDIGGDE